MSIVSISNDLPANRSLLQHVRRLVAADLATVNDLISQYLCSDVALINQVTSHILQSGGKRLRPLLALLSAKALGYAGKQHCLLAAIIELVHTATLLHDDVVDHSYLRRGRSTANAVWGDQASVLVGDFLYSRAFQMMTDLNCLRTMSLFACATNTIARGEVLQLMNCHQATASEAEYLEVIRCKTAQLFEVATQLGAVLAKAGQPQEDALTQYGLRFGLAYQLIDDVLDYSAPLTTLGKTIGNDLAEGKPTLPLIYALQHGTPLQQATLRMAIEQKGVDDLDAVLEILHATRALQYTRHAAHQQVELAVKALAPIPDSPYRQALITLTDFILGQAQQ